MSAAPDPVLAYLVDDLAALGAFGIAVELTVAVGPLVVVGTPIADSEYFARLGAGFRATIERALAGVSFHHGTGAVGEFERGWQEDQLLQLAQAREQGYRRHGEASQQLVRERVQGRPQRLREYPADEQEDRTLRVWLVEQLGDGVEPARRFLHLRDASILAGGPVGKTLPLWRARLSDVSAWNLERGGS